MNYGHVVKEIESLPPGRLLMRQERGEESLLLTTAAKGEWGDRLVLEYATTSGGLFNSAMSYAENYPQGDYFWDVTDVAEVRPVVESRYFGRNSPDFAEIMLSESDGLVILGEYKDRAQIHRPAIRISDGQPTPALPMRCLRFKKWRLVLIDDETGHEAAELMRWTAKTTEATPHVRAI